MTPDPAKLTGLPPVRYLNLARSPDRRDFMEKQARDWALTRFERHEGVDAALVNIEDHIAGEITVHGSKGYLGCMVSHFNSIAAWLVETDEPFAMFMEDDCLLEFVACWPFEWPAFFAAMPYNWDALQLSVINSGRMVFRSHFRLPGDASAACYVLTRRYAEKLIAMHRDGDRWRFDMVNPQRNSIEDILFASGVTVTTPLFSYANTYGSLLHPHHVDEIHAPSHRLYERFWRENAAKIDDWSEMFEPIGAVAEKAKYRDLYHLRHD